jgi:hypothetical protein
MNSLLAWQLLCGALLLLNTVHLVKNLKAGNHLGTAISVFASVCCIYALVA